MRIVGAENVNEWGCQIVTSDAFDYDYFRTGQTLLHSVEIKGCSQKDTHRAALRFEKAKINYHTVENCAIHDGLSWGIQIKNSR